LDTHALIWLQTKQLARPTLTLLTAAALRGELLASTVSAWEIGLLHARAHKTGVGLVFEPDPKVWFARAVGAPGLLETPLTAAIAIDATALPGSFHRDPGDRFLVATARHLGATLVTRDRAILDYAAAGFVRAQAC